MSVECLEDRAVPTAVAVPSGIVSWWTANNTAADTMGLNNATLTGVTYTSGEVGKAFSFDGVDDWAALGDPSSLAFTASFSIEGWIKVNGPPTGYNFGSIMFRGDDRPGLDPYQLVILPNGDLQFQINSTTAGASVEAPIPTGQFVHVAATLDDATGAMTLYENGVVVAQTTTTARPFGPLDPTQQPGVGIGNSNALSNYNVPFNGLIDELSVYNRALTSGEVLGIDKAGSSGKVLGPIAVDFPSVVDGSGGATTPVTFTITRTGSLSGSLTVNWTTADDTATAGTDYTAASGTVTFADGQATQTVQVTTLDTNVPKANVDFKLIATPAGGTSVMGVATIVNDDAAISVSNASATEGSSQLRSLGQFVYDGSGVLARPRLSTFAPDANHDGVKDLYLVSADTASVDRFDGVTGAYLDTFVTPGSGGLVSPVDLVFGPDGDLYVSDWTGNQVLRYDGATGAFLNVVASGLSSPEGLTFGPDGNLYIANQGSSEVLRVTSSGVSPFVTAGSGGLSQPRKAEFGPDGNLYVASNGTGQVLRYNGQTGAFLNVFVTTGATTGPMWLDFGGDGLLYVAQHTGSPNSIARYTASTGAFVDSLDVGTGWAFQVGPDHLVYDSGTSGGNYVNRLGPSSIASFTVTLNLPSTTPVTVAYATASGTATSGSDFTPVSGTLTFAPGQTSQTVLVPILNDTLVSPTETFTLNLSNATGATITGAQGTGTIYDDDSIKFYVVNDGSSVDQNYRYGRTGIALGNTALNGGDSAPRGIAANAAGTTDWVIDANKRVYVYNAAGSLLGSWSPGSLSPHANVQGVATNGTDIWIVDAYQRKVYRYAGAASRLSGSQSASSSFYLNSSDTNPTDIVTDGTSFWVVDAAADMVFKYTLSGSFLGSWTLGAVSSPTGITLDPTNVGTLWVVDSAADRVYKYDNAAGVTSGSLWPSTSFALATGNTNPEGIADPPAPALVAGRTTMLTGTAHPSGSLAAHHGTTIPALRSSWSGAARFPDRRPRRSDVVAG
jgi:hypothetical protein